MAAASTAISSLGCQMILRAPHTSHSSSKPTSCFTGGKLHSIVSTKGFTGMPLPAWHRGTYQSKRLLFCKAGTGEGGRVRRWVLVSVASEELDTIPARGGNSADQKEGIAVGGGKGDVVGGGGDHDDVFASEGGEVEDSHVGSTLSTSSSAAEEVNERRVEQMAERAVNAAIVLAAGTAAVTKLLTIDHDYWHGWTLYEILRYAPQHNWTAYEEALKTNPVLAKMMISGIVYSLGDWIAQCYEGKPLFEFDRVRMLRSGLVGFTLHGSLSHYYYHFCEALFPFQDWWVVPAKVVFDQTAWSAFWNSIYYVVLGFLRYDSPEIILDELKSAFWPMLTAGWKLWPFAHLITYGVIPVEQRLLWVDCVELIWVTILSTYSNEKSEARNSESTT